MKRVKIFKFKKNDVVDLTHTPEFGCNVIQCGKDKYTLTDYKPQEGHDDSLPYSAILCLNNQPICKCLNDGWGGSTELTPVDIRAKAVMASADITLSKFKWSFRTTEMHLTLDFIADTLAISRDHEIKSLEKK